jgi:recombination associated protein RdgC
MNFRNVTLFQFPTACRFHELPWNLDDCALKPVGPLELSSRGFVSPYGRGDDRLVAAQGEAAWLTIGGEDRMLPGSVVNDLLAKKLEAIEKAEGRKPGGRTRKRIKDELITELLPRAFVKPSRVDAVLLFDLGLLAIDTSSRRVAESVVGEIRRCLGSFPALPLNAERSPRTVLTDWLTWWSPPVVGALRGDDPMPHALALADEAQLTDPVDHGATVKLARQELGSEEVAKHLEVGKQCTRLALTLDDHVSFTLGEDLVLRKFRLLDGAIDQLESTEREDLVAELDARMALFVGELRRVWAVLKPAFKISEVTP